MFWEEMRKRLFFSIIGAVLGLPFLRLVQNILHLQTWTAAFACAVAGVVLACIATAVWDAFTAADQAGSSSNSCAQ